MLPNGFLEPKIIHISLSLPLIGRFGAALGPLLAALGRSKTDPKTVQNRPPKKTFKKPLLVTIFDPF